MRSVRLSEMNPQGRALNTDRSQPRGRSHAGLGFNNRATHQTGHELWTGPHRGASDAVGWCSSHADRSIFGRGVVDARRQDHRRRAIIDVGGELSPVSPVPRDTAQTSTSSHVAPDRSAVDPRTPVLVELAGAWRSRHRGGHQGRSAGGQVSRGNKEKQSNHALQRPHSRGTPAAGSPHTARHAVRR